MRIGMSTNGGRLHRSNQARGAPGARLGTALVMGALFIAPIAARAQGTIAGTVVDAANTPIQSAQVLVRGTRFGALTDVAGKFRIAGLTEPAGTAVTLDVRRIGYRSDTVRAAVGDENVMVRLSTSAVQLNEVVVTGTPGAQEKRQLGVDVSQIDAASVVAKAPVPDVQQLINGRAPGVTILNNSGVIGAGAVVRIRGVSSFSLTNQPLIYVDGVRVDNTQSTGPTFLDGSGGTQGFGASTTTRWSDFNPDDIESIEIVKGPAATTLYGTEAANGVIQIITKKGAQGKPTWDVTVRQGANWFANPSGRLWTNYAPDGDGNIVTENFDELQARYGKDIFQTGHLQNYTLSLGGGSPLFRYHASGSIDDNDGVEPVNRQRNYNARASLGIYPSDKIDVQTNVAYITGKTDLAGEAGFGGTTWTTYYMDPSVIDTPHLGFLSGTPDAYYQEYTNFQAINRFTGSVQFNHHPTTWFNQRLTIGLDQGYEDSEQLATVNHDLSFFFGTDADSGFKVVDTRNNMLTTINYAGTLTFPLPNSFKSATSVGGDLYKTNTKWVKAQGFDFPAPGLTALKSTTAGQSTQEFTVEDNTVGIFGQEQLSWNDRAFLTFGLRVDDNSSFGTNFSAVYYPKVSGSWVISEEPFFHLPYVTTLKLRAAYGQSGQAPLPYSAVPTFTAAPGPGGATVTPLSFGNPDLGPEKGYQTEMGFDAGLFHDRAGLEFTYYTGGTNDAILETPVAPSAGYPGTKFINAGKLTKHGFEIALRGTPWQTPNTDLSLGLNLAWDHTNVVSLLGGADTLVSSTNVLQVVGHPVGSWFAKKVVGATVNSDGSITDVMCDGGPANGGQPVLCSQAPNVFLGNTIPTFQGSFNTTLRFLKNFTAYALLDSKTGYKVLNGDERVRCHLFAQCRINYFPQEFDAAAVGASTSSSLYSDIIQDASFLKLREVSLTYSLPQSWANAFRATGASITLAGRNLATWTRYPGLEPEASFQGGSRGSFGQWTQDVLPQLEQFITTVHLTF